MQNNLSLSLLTLQGDGKLTVDEFTFALDEAKTEAEAFALASEARSPQHKNDPAVRLIAAAVERTAAAQT